MKNELCERYRNDFDLRDDEPNTEREAHVAMCPNCQARMHRAKAFDHAVKSSLIQAVPDDLTARLLALVPGLVVTPALVRTQRWKRQRRAFMWASSLLTILALVGMVYGVYLLGMSLGMGHVLADLGTVPSQFFDWLYRTIPSSRQVVAFMLAIQQPLQWTILLMLIWQVWERMPQAQTLRT